MLKGLGNGYTSKIKDISKYKLISVLIPYLVRISISF
jgi:hypothetical protein